MKKEKTMHELAKEFPDKSYRELEIYRDADRQEEAHKIPLTESQKSQEDLEPIKKGACVIGEARKDREKMDPQERIKELEVALANALAVNESHQKLNGKLQEKVTAMQQENRSMDGRLGKVKSVRDELYQRIDKMRKSGM